MTECEQLGDGRSGSLGGRARAAPDSELCKSSMILRVARRSPTLHGVDLVAEGPENILQSLLQGPGRMEMFLK